MFSNYGTIFILSKGLHVFADWLMEFGVQWMKIGEHLHVYSTSVSKLLPQY